MKSPFDSNSNSLLYLEPPTHGNPNHITGPLWGEAAWPAASPHSRSVVQSFDNVFVYDRKSPQLTWRSGGCFINAYELVNLGTLKFSTWYKNHVFQCTGKIFCVEFQKAPLKFHTKYLTHTLKDVYFVEEWRFKSFQIYKLLSVLFKWHPISTFKWNLQLPGTWFSTKMLYYQNRKYHGRDKTVL